MELNSWNPILDAMEETVDAYIEYTGRLNVDITDIPPAPSSEGDLIPSEQGLVHIDSKLSKLADIEEKLRVSRLHLQSLRNTSVTLAPINRLPVDVLAMVVLAGYGEDRMEQERYQKRQKQFEIFHERLNFSEDEDSEVQHFPTTFSHVCRRWRAITLSIATAWSDLTFGPGYSYEKAAVWIQRTKQADLTLELFTLDTESTANFQRALEIVGPNVSRVTSLVLETHRSDNILEALNHFSAHGRPPRLKELTLLTSGRANAFTLEHFGKEKWEVLMDMTKELEYLRFRGAYFPLESPAYRGLKILHLEGLTNPDVPDGQPRHWAFLAIFEESPELESLTLIDVEPHYHSRGVSVRPRTVALQKLKTLEIDEMSLELTCFVLSVLSTPALEKLSLSNFLLGRGASLVADAELPSLLLPFFKNLQPASLKFFDLHQPEMSRMDPLIKQILACTPELESLCLGDDESISMTVLGAIRDPERLVPKLERLGLVHCHFSAQLLEDVILERNKSGSLWPIRHLVVECCQLEDSGYGIRPVLEKQVEELGWEGNSVVTR